MQGVIRALQYTDCARVIRDRAPLCTTARPKDAKRLKYLHLPQNLSIAILP